ncbi:MAG TPA: MFS transporter, partial [Anaerolineales bacterium]|nr:MFS transporter [Anaerolineales bacterium]
MPNQPVFAAALGASLRPPSRAPQGSSLITGRLALFLVAMALTEAMRAMTSIQIPVYLRSLGADVAQVGLFFTISAIAPVALMVLGGWLSDTIGRLLSFYIGCVAGGLAFVVYAISPTWEFALLAPPLQAISYSLIRPSYRAYIADHTRPENRGRVFAIAEAAANVTWIFGGPLGGFIAHN